MNDEIGHVPLDKIIGDLLIGGFASLFGLFLLVSTSVSLGWSLAFGFFLIAALWFLWRSWALYQLRLEITSKGFEINGAEHLLSEIQTVKLRFYGSFRQKQKGEGTYQLTVKSKGKRSFQVDQRLSNFQELLENIAQANFSSDEKTRGYFTQHGINL